MSQQPGEAEGSHRVVGSVDAVVASGPDNVGTCGHCQTVRARPATHEGIHKEPVSDASLARTVSNLVDGGRECGAGRAVSISRPPLRAASSRWEQTTAHVCGRRGDRRGIAGSLP